MLTGSRAPPSRARCSTSPASCRVALERTIDQAEVERLFHLGATRAQVDRHPTRRGVGKLRRILEDHVAGSTLTWSWFEEQFLELTRTVRLPQPEVNQWIVLNDGEPAIRADFLWRDRRVVVETDGWRFHRSRAAFERNRRDDQRLTLAGWGHVRITGVQLRDERARIARTVERLLGL